MFFACKYTYIPFHYISLRYVTLHYITLHMHAYMHTYMHAYVDTYLPTFLPTYLHTYTHTYTQYNTWIDSCLSKLLCISWTSIRLITVSFPFCWPCFLKKRPKTKPVSPGRWQRNPEVWMGRLWAGKKLWNSHLWSNQQCTTTTQEYRRNFQGPGGWFFKLGGARWGPTSYK